MIGIVVATHNRLADALIETVEFIIGEKLESVESVSINLNENADDLRKKISQKIKEVKNNEGVLILTDMFGGTPSNLSYSFLKDGQVEVISGVNLPILLKAVNIRKKMELSECASTLLTFGKRSISLASGILKGESRG
ncbi:MAG: PTS sugar transporter subunit IIA [Desulfobacterales bacterium]|nr:PTS sugar transporter subunit IIA [Desulfobacterales bacterium]